MFKRFTKKLTSVLATLGMVAVSMSFSTGSAAAADITSSDGVGVTEHLSTGVFDPSISTREAAGQYYYFCTNLGVQYPGIRQRHLVLVLVGWMLTLVVGRSPM
ncbi:hypothetical protein ACFPH7_05515 [Arcanobacterium bovis]